MTDRVRCHFGEWLQGRDRPGGPLVLLTLMGPDLYVSRDPGGAALVPRPVLDRFAEALGRPVPPIPLASDIVPGCGTGVSTAALILHGRAAGVDDPAALARACLAAEGAVDPLMHGRPDTLLWAPRAASTVAHLDPPRAEIVGGFWGAPTPTDPADEVFPDISDLLSRWAGAEGALAICAALATESARRTTEMRGPDDDPTDALATRLGALGWVRAHTGSARALVFAPGDVPPGAEAALAEAGFARTLRAGTGGAT